MLQGILKYWEIYRVQIKNNFVREAVYRANFLTSLIVDMVWIITEATLFTVIYANVPEIAGWTKPQVFFFLGIFFASDALFTAFFQRNFFLFSDLVNKGDLDIVLTKPAHPLFLALSRWINLTGLFNVFMGLFIAWSFAEAAGFEGGTKWLLLPLWLAVGVSAGVLLRFSFAVWIFWTDRNWALVRLYYQFFAFATKPDAIYPGVIRYLILTVLPFAFIGSVPARALLYGLQPWEYLALGGVLLGFFALNTFLWRKGLRRYQSASS